MKPFFCLLVLMLVFILIAGCTTTTDRGILIARARAAPPAVVEVSKYHEMPTVTPIISDITNPGDEIKDLPVFNVTRVPGAFCVAVVSGQLKSAGYLRFETLNRPGQTFYAPAGEVTRTYHCDDRSPARLFFDNDLIWLGTL